MRKRRTAAGCTDAAWAAGNPRQRAEEPGAGAKAELACWLQKLRAQEPGCLPRASDDRILAISNPPGFTACPNPWLGRFVAQHRPPDRPRPPIPPFAGSLQAGPRHAVQVFHPYHTKVPPRTIRALIEHYTQPGDLVLDAFCGSGMTGVAARECGRHAVLADLSPLAAFVAGANTSPCDPTLLRAALEGIIAAAEAELGHLYRTPAPEGGSVAVNHYVWSDVFACPDCEARFPFFDHGARHELRQDKVVTLRAFPCPACGAQLNVRRVRRIVEGDRKLRQLAWVGGGRGRQRFGRPPLPEDLALAEEAERLLEAGPWHPRDAVDPAGYSARLAQLGAKRITDVSRYLSPRNLLVFADLWQRAGAVDDPALRHALRAILTSVFDIISERQGYFGGGGGMSGKLYMPIVRMEKNVYQVLRRKLRRALAAERAKAEGRGHVLVSTQSAGDLGTMPDECVDYVYVDPPFGANIIYSELNLMLEAWLRVRTAPEAEAVIDPSQGKDLDDYQQAMERCFRELFRVLKPGRWMSLQFHNTQPRIWTALQEALGRSGFVLASASALDKGSTTILGDIRPGSAKHDHVFHAYKPTTAVERSFRLAESSPEAAWRFTEELLGRLPLQAQDAQGNPTIVAKRSDRVLFNQMVAFHVLRGRQVPLAAAAFYRGLRERFVEVEGQFFLEGQARGGEKEPD